MMNLIIFVFKKKNMIELLIMKYIIKINSFFLFKSKLKR